MPLTEPELIRVLREALAESEESLTRLARKCETTASQLSRFARGEQTLKLPTAARLFECLGLRVVRPKRSRKARP